MDLEPKIIEYKKQLQECLNEMGSIRKQIAELDRKGVELTAQANILSGKIEALEELSNNTSISTT